MSLIDTPETLPESRSDIESLRRAWNLAGPLKGQVARGVGFRFLQSMMLGLSYGVVVWVVVELAEGRELGRIDIQDSQKA